MRDGCHLAVVVLVVVGGCAGLDVVVSVVGSAIVSIYGVILTIFVLFFRTFWAAAFAWTAVLIAIWRAIISSAVSISSSSTVGCWVVAASSTIVASADEVWFLALNFRRSSTHFVVPSTSSMFFSLFL